MHRSALLSIPLSFAIVIAAAIALGPRGSFRGPRELSTTAPRAESPAEATPRVSPASSGTHTNTGLVSDPTAESWNVQSVRIDNRVAMDW